MGSKQLGQFYTTNRDYILQGLDIPQGTTEIVEPFCGKGDLIRGLGPEYTISGYDIDPKHATGAFPVQVRDTLLNPPDWTGKFVLTNPPYLARNKSTNKTIFNQYKVDDLYKAFIKQLCTIHASGGIVILPVNFWCSTRAGDLALRSRFLEIYSVDRINIFEEQVFDDTSYGVCAFRFSIHSRSEQNPPTNLVSSSSKSLTDTKELVGFDLSRSVGRSNNPTSVYMYPNSVSFTTTFSEDNLWTIGGELISHVESRYTVTRGTEQTDPNTNILIKCIDDTVQINAKIVQQDELYIDTTPKLTARSYMSLRITPKISLVQQRELVQEFNRILTENRRRYHSMFLTNYREGGRKRITFELVYNLVKSILNRL